MELTGFNESWWLGLSVLHTVFAREHNVVCDELRAHYRGWSDDRVFNTARLVISALIAKIHTVEWTPAILATQPIDLGPESQLERATVKRLADQTGYLAGGCACQRWHPSDQAGPSRRPFSLTEDFVTVYRLHPLIPDEYRFHRSPRADCGCTIGGSSISPGTQADDDCARWARQCHVLVRHITSRRDHAQQLSAVMQAFERDGERIDLSVVDLVRTRRRGVPRYNDFRAGLHKPRLKPLGTTQ